MSDRFTRQSFLGKNSTEQMANAKVALIGFGGGGSVILPQLLHMGFRKVKVFDADVVEDSNTHRLAGIIYPDDVVNATPKVEVAKRVATNIVGECCIETFKMSWQEGAEYIRDCQIVIGCVDSYSERDQLERFCRRHLIVYIDIGMGVKASDLEAPQVFGQVILSMPGQVCMHCMGFLTQSKLNEERSRYGDAGPKAQVIWANTGLASFAVGLAVNLITDWSKSLREPVYKVFNFNTGDVGTHPRLQFLNSTMCTHYSEADVGTPVFAPL